MTGIKGGKKAGPGRATKRHLRRFAASDYMVGLTKPAIRRLARRGGVKRISGLVYEETRDALRSFLSGLVKDSIEYADSARRKTVTALDVVHACKRQGRQLYGFGGF